MIFEPSGAHAGLASVVGLFVRFVWPLPSAFITNTSYSSPTLPAYTI
jgi:hypothetical protein